MEIRTITAPFTDEVLRSLKVGDIVNVSGIIYAGRDAVLPKIVEMIDVTEKYGVITWTCRTDRGLRSFRIRSRTNDIKVLYNGRVLIRDSNDNRYEIDDYRTMDKKSRAILAKEL